MNIEQMRAAYSEMMGEFYAKKPVFTSVRTGEQGTSEYFEAKWREAHLPILTDSVVIQFPVPERPDFSDNSDHGIAAAGS